MKPANNYLLFSAIAITISAYLFCLLIGCSQVSEERRLNDAAQVIKEYAIKKNPKLKGQKLNVSWVIDGGLSVDGDDVCACLIVCDGSGNNCTGCFCSPPNCSTCK